MTTQATANVACRAGKEALIDGASLEIMSKQLGVRFIAAQGLHTTLRYHVGTQKNFSRPPVITMRPDLAHEDNHLANAFRRKGFEVVGATRYNEEDDRFLIKRITQVQPVPGTEIVMVGADHCYIPHLAKKAEEGVKVLWMAADISNCTGGSCIGKELRSHLGKTFEFVDLAKYVRYIEFREPPTRWH